MALYNRESKLSEAIVSHPELIPVVTRLGVGLGVGEQTIGTICLKGDIDVDFFLSVVNTFLDDDYFPVNARDTFTLEKTADYLRKTSRYYLHVQLPNIRRHFESLVSRSGSDNNLQRLYDFFEETSMRLQETVERDEKSLYPAFVGGNAEEETETSVRSHTMVAEQLHDLLYLFVAHIRGDYDRNLATAVVSAIFSLERDYGQNNRIRRRILLPLAGEGTKEW